MTGYRRRDRLWDEAMLANLRAVAADEAIPAAERPARVVAYALFCAEMERCGAAWPHDCAEAGRIAVEALRRAGVLTPGADTAEPGGS
jgi:hypothetical protein